MKKIITLILLLTGMVGTVSAYYSLPGDWDNWVVSKNQFVNDEVTIFLNGSTTYEFKFYNSSSNTFNGAGNDWQTVTMTSDNCSSWKLNSNDKNVKILTTIAGEYTFLLGWEGSVPLISVTYPSTSTYTRSVTSGNFGTICLPYAATVTGATVFKIVSKVESDGRLTGINLQSVNSMEAGKAYIYKATGSTLTATLSGDAAVATTADCMLGNLGTTATNVPTDNYIVKDNQIRKVIDGGAATVGQYKAYITSDIESLQAGARSTYCIGFDDESAGIDDIESTRNVDNESFYNLAGQRVTQPMKGMLIVNGKKILRK